MDDVLHRKLFNQQPTPTRGTGITASFLPVQNYQDGGDVEPMIGFPEGSEPTKDWAIPRGLYNLIGRPVGRTIKNIGPMLGDLMDPFGAYKPFKGMVKPKEVTDALEKEIQKQKDGSFQSKYRYGDLINDASAISNFQDNVPTEIIQRKTSEKNRKDRIRGLNYLKEGVQEYFPGTARNKQRILQKIIKDPSTPENIKQQSIAQLNKINQQIANTNLRKQNLPTSDVALTDDVTTVDTQPQMEKSVIPVMDDPDFQTQLNNLGDVTVQSESNYGNYREAAEDYDPDRGYGDRGAIIGAADERGPFQIKPTSASQNYGYGAFKGQTLRQVLGLPEDASQFDVDRAMQDPEIGKSVHDEITKTNLLELAKIDTKETDPAKILEEGINSPKTRALSQLAYNRGIGGTKNWINAGMNIDALSDEQKTRMKRAAGATTDDALKLALSGEVPVKDKKEIKVASAEVEDYGTKDNEAKVPDSRKDVPKENIKEKVIDANGDTLIVTKDNEVVKPDVLKDKKPDVSKEEAKVLNKKEDKVINILQKQGINISKEDLLEFGELYGSLAGIEELKGARRRDFALTLAAGLLSHRSYDSGISGFLDIFGKSLAPAVDASKYYNEAIMSVNAAGGNLLADLASEAFKANIKRTTPLSKPVPVFAVRYDVDGNPIGQIPVGQVLDQGKLEILSSDNITYNTTPHSPEITEFINSIDTSRGTNGGYIDGKIITNSNLHGKPLFVIGDAASGMYIEFDALYNMNEAGRNAVLKETRPEIVNSQKGIRTVGDTHTIYELARDGIIPNPFGASGMINNFLGKTVLTASDITNLLTKFKPGSKYSEQKINSILEVLNDEGATKKDKEAIFENMYLEQNAQAIVDKHIELKVLPEGSTWADYQRYVTSRTSSIVNEYIQADIKLIGTPVAGKTYTEDDHKKRMKELNDLIPEMASGKTRDERNKILQWLSKNPKLESMVKTPYRDVVRMLEFNMHMRYARTAQENNRLLKDTIEESKGRIGVTNFWLPLKDVEGRLKTAYVIFSGQYDSALEKLYLPETLAKRGYKLKDGGSGPPQFRVKNPFAAKGEGVKTLEPVKKGEEQKAGKLESFMEDIELDQGYIDKVLKQKEEETDLEKGY